MMLLAIGYLITGALAQTGTKIALDSVDTVDAPTALRDLLEQEYVDEGCEAAGWGPFPNASSTSLTAEAYARAHGTSTRTTTPATSRAPGRSIRISSRGCSP